MVYKATLDWTSKIIIAAVTIFFGGLMVSFLSMIKTVSGNLVGLSMIILVILSLISIYVMCYLYKPLKYIVTKNEIKVKRRFNDITFDTSEIIDAFVVRPELMKWTWRTFGNGGLFGYYGEFRNDSFGDMVWYATRRSNYIMLETAAKEKIVMTPDNMEMVNEIKTLIGKRNAITPS